MLKGSINHAAGYDPAISPPGYNALRWELSTINRHQPFPQRVLLPRRQSYWQYCFSQPAALPFSMSSPCFLAWIHPTLVGARDNTSITSWQVSQSSVPV
jgi:hypothetical protein